MSDSAEPAGDDEAIDWDSSAGRPRRAHREIGQVHASLHTSVEVSPGNSGVDVLLALRLERGFSHTRSAAWSTDADTLDAIRGRLVYSEREPRSEVIIIERDDSLIHVILAEGTITARVAATEPRHASLGLAFVRTRIPRAPVAPPDDRLRVHVRWNDPYGEGGRNRLVEMAPWEDVEANYAASTRDGIQRLIDADASTFDEQGRIIIWHGDPGTGKTHAIRALAHRWRDWCDLVTVVDPEELFKDSEYMFDVASQSRGCESGERHNLVVLEDTGELLSADAKERTGQGLSRLLNLCDGIVGQGMRLIVLITTNEPVERMHSAVTRPGRCAAQVRFDPLSAEEATEWLSRAGRDERVSAPIALAELYARLRDPVQGDAQNRGASRRIGFAA